MELEGKIWKDGKLWLVEVPALDAMTQGRSRKEAISMIKDLVFEQVLSYFESELDDGFDIAVLDHEQGVIGITSSNNKLLLALSLRKQREVSGLTVREAAERLGSKSPNAYAQYEKGKTSISLDKFERLLRAANPDTRMQLRIA